MSKIDDNDGFDILEEIQHLNGRYQATDQPGSITIAGPVGYHNYFDHEHGLDYALQAAMHAALDNGLMELMLDADMIREEHGEVTPETVATELEIQLDEFYGIRGHFAESWADQLKQTLERWEGELE